MVNRLRSDSAASSLASSETSDSPSIDGSDAGQTRGDLTYPYRSHGYDDGSQWDAEIGVEEPAALALFDNGEERIFDGAKLEEIGGLNALSTEVIESLAGELSDSDKS